MTSLSRIIRSSYAKQTEDKKVEIHLKNLFTEQFIDGDYDTAEELVITKEEMFAERNQILADAHREIEQQKSEFEKYRNEQLEMIEQLKQLWEEEKLVLEQQAYDIGFQQGYEEGIKKAHADMAEGLKTANEVIENSKQNARAYLEEQERVILELALTASERIIGATLDRNEELYVSIVKKGLKEAREMKEIKIYVSPQFHKVVSQNLDELVEMFPTDVPLLIFVNEDLNSSESYIETNHGRIVVSIDEQLNELRLKLMELLNSKD
ncbi:flagellar assembly protein FliH [Ureibacillus xyleni]|uniref:Flagellar assembly protein FliH n=1 Tax=Ureibacillus xyleni TaxID=614648 RepID=A0A285RG13_9BACL|nr:flagellar assembly protein FliH [Ureibacillus xyleni]